MNKQPKGNTPTVHEQPYCVKLHRTMYYSATLHVLAGTREQAERLAEKRGRRWAKWTMLDDDCYAVGTAAVKGGRHV